MKKLAITGNIASGKSLVESFFQEEGIITVDTDTIVHDILEKDEEIIEKISKIFDVDVKNTKGAIDRKKVGKIVFNDKIKLQELEKILHPEVKKIIDDFFQKNLNEKLVVVSVPQLYEAGWEKFFDYVLMVVADDDVRMQRLIQRNHLSEEEAQKRLSVQISQNEKIKKGDFVLDNSQDMENTKIQFKKIFEELLNLSLIS